jgi:hypothetical protein
MLGLLLALRAQADDEPVSLDSVDTGHTVSQDKLDTGKTKSLDTYDTGKTVDQDTLDVGHTDTLDSADKGHTVDQDSIDTGKTESLSAAERPPEAAPKPPGPLPSIGDEWLRAKAQAARDTLVTAEQRAAAADAAYSEMRAHDFPRGEEAAAIAKEYETSRELYEKAKTNYDEIVGQVEPAAPGN